MRARREWLAMLLAPTISFAANAAVPAVKGMPYDEAKQSLIQAGWAPASNIKQEADDTYAQSYAKEYGFTEVESCAGSGLLQCAFIFVDPKAGTRLRVVTLGEEMPVVSQVEPEASTPTKAEAQQTNVIDSYFKGLQENSRRLYTNMTTQYARYLYYLVKQNPSDLDHQINRFCYQQTSQAQSQQAEILGMMRNAGANANNEIRSMLNYSDATKKKLVDLNKTRDVLLVDVATSTMMFAAYGQIRGDRFTSLVASGCREATAQARVEGQKPDSELAYQAN